MAFLVRNVLGAIETYDAEFSRFGIEPVDSTLARALLGAGDAFARAWMVAFGEDGSCFATARTQTPDWIAPALRRGGGP